MTSTRHFNAEMWDNAAFFMSCVTYSYFGEFTYRILLCQSEVNKWISMGRSCNLSDCLALVFSF